MPSTGVWLLICILLFSDIYKIMKKSLVFKSGNLKRVVEKQLNHGVAVLKKAVKKNDNFTV